MNQAAKLAQNEAWCEWRPGRVPSKREVHYHGFAAGIEFCTSGAAVEAVAHRLAERDHGGPLPGGEVCEGYKDEARMLLAAAKQAGGREW